jgi:Na+/melibiose symporter-like transporter
MAKNTKPDDIDEVRDVHVTPSTLDNHTHSEIQLLYRESTETLRFVKNHQWMTVGATLLVFFALIFVAGFVDADAQMARQFMGITITITCAAIFMLVLYQFWTHNEQTKIDYMQPHMSSLFADIRALKSKREGNIHRYVILSFMIIVIILGALVVHLSFGKIVP